MIVKLTPKQFQSTHPVRGATTHHVHRPPCTRISIHAPREGCDDARASAGTNALISIHAPREGCDYTTVTINGVTHISIHAPREGCDHIITPNDYDIEISIHAPREGCDTTATGWTGCICVDFNPRTP